MPRFKSIGIPVPCHENWHYMTPAKKGRFCSSCQKTVRDFTHSSDREIAKSLKSGTTCGRFLPTQLNRELIIPQHKNSLWLAASATILGFLTLVTETVFSQNTVYTEQLIQPDQKTIIPTASDQIIVTGTVSDSVSRLHGAVINIKGADISTQSDIDGKFAIEANRDDILEFNYLGYKTVEIPIKGNNIINGSSGRY